MKYGRASRVDVDKPAATSTIRLPPSVRWSMRTRRKGSSAAMAAPEAESEVAEKARDAAVRLGKCSHSNRIRDAGE